MPRPLKPARPGRRFRPTVVGVLTAASLLALTGLALAATFTIHTRLGTVTNFLSPNAHATKHEKIVVTSHGWAVYYLTGDSRTHRECTRANGCFSFWPPVTVRNGVKPSKPAGLKGKLGVFHRGTINQVTLNGHPLYKFFMDKQHRVATGEGIQSFGGTWHVVTPKWAGASAGGGGGGGWY